MSTLFKTMKAAVKVGGYAVRLFSHKKQIGILAGIESREDAIEMQAHADFLGADEAQLIDNHPDRAMTISPMSMTRD